MCRAARPLHAVDVAGSRRCLVGHLLGRGGRGAARVGRHDRGSGPEPVADGAVRRAGPRRRPGGPRHRRQAARASRAAASAFATRACGPWCSHPPTCPRSSTSCRPWPPWRPPAASCTSPAPASCGSRRATASRRSPTGLRALGADVDEFPDGFHIRGARRLTGGHADAAHDHRLAMAFAIAGLAATGPDDGERRRCRRRLVPGFLRHPDDAHACRLTRSIWSASWAQASRLSRGVSARGSTGVSRISTSASRRAKAAASPRSSPARASPTSAQVERRVLLDLLPLRHVVVATGGGTFADADNRALINRDGLSVWLDVPLAGIVDRVPPTAGGRWPPTARSSSASTTRDAPPISTPTYTSTPAIAPSTHWSSNCSTVWRRDHVRYLVISDIHGNLEALDTVLTRRRGTVRRGARARRPGRLRRRSQRRRRSRARARGRTA